MNTWNLLNRDINKNLRKLLDAQEIAEEKGSQEFKCPVCGGDAYWSRAEHSKRLACGCTRCGMYLRG